MSALFFVPPNELGFRVQSKRSIYGDWYDGTKAFFSDQFASLWWERMQSLQCTNPDRLKEQYRQNTSEDFKNLWEQQQAYYSQGYLITYPEMEMPGLELMHQNEDYLLYQLPTPKSQRPNLSCCACNN
ncbi:MAG: hypothetical protein U5L96_15615 [Owenweeksia sp.]|nr:hypothetical protein [Owenweeksia sp.]